METNGLQADHCEVGPVVGRTTTQLARQRAGNLDQIAGLLRTQAVRLPAVHDRTDIRKVKPVVDDMDADRHAQIAGRWKY